MSRCLCARQVSNTAAATTAMLLTVSFYVIATTLPATVVYVLEESFPQGSLHLTDSEIAVDDQWQRFFRYLTVRKVVEEVREVVGWAVKRRKRRKMRSILRDQPSLRRCNDYGKETARLVTCRTAGIGSVVLGRYRDGRPVKGGHQSQY